MKSTQIAIGAALVGFVTFAGSASAQDTAAGTLAVTGTVISSISMTIESAGGTTSGLGTDTASTALGSFSKFGTTPTGFTKVNTVANEWTLSSTIGVKVVKANSISTAYTLNAKLNSAPTTGVAWTVNAVLLNATTAQALTAAGAYGSTASYNWDIAILDSVAAGALDNTVMFDAIAG
jgi:hypothetical protein